MTTSADAPGSGTTGSDARPAGDRLEPGVVLEHLGIAVFAVDGALQLTAINPEMRALVGAAAAALASREVAPFTFLWPADRIRWTGALAKAAQGTPLRITARVAGATGDPITVIAELRPVPAPDGDPAGVVVGLTTGLESPQSAGAQLLAGGALSEDSPDAILRWDADNRVVYMNRAAELNSGFTREDILGVDLHGLPAPEATYQASVERALATGLDHVDEFEYQPITGETMYVRTRYLPETDAHGQVSHVITITQDVTPQKQVELELARLVLINTRSAQREASYRRVSEITASGEGLTAVCEAVCQEAVSLLSALQAWVTAHEPDGPGRFVGGARDGDAESGGTRHDCDIVVGPELWGVLSVVVPGDPPGDMVDTMRTLAQLVATACVNARMMDELAEMARTDSMTGLANRRAFFEALDGEVAKARRYGDDLAVAIVDLDHFKRVNDEFGHGVGDDVLCAASRRLVEVVRRGELFARIGGEEFAWILPRVDLEDAMGVLERARAVVSSPPIEPVGVMTMSAGVAVLREGDSVKSLIRRADAALYRAKSGGRDRVEPQQDADG